MAKKKVMLSVFLLLPFLLLFGSDFALAKDCGCELKNQDTKCSVVEIKQGVCISQEFIKTVVVQGKKFNLAGKIKVSKGRFEITGADKISFNDILINYSKNDLTWTNNPSIEIAFYTNPRGIIKGGDIFNQPGLLNRGKGGGVKLSADLIDVGNIGAEGHRADGGNVFLFARNIKVKTVSTASIDGMDLTAANFNLYGKAGSFIARASESKAGVNSFTGEYIFSQGLKSKDVIIKSNRFITVKNEIYNFSGCFLKKVCDQEKSLCQKYPGKYPFRSELFCNESSKVILQNSAKGTEWKIYVYGVNNNAQSDFVEKSSGKIYQGEGTAESVSLAGEDSSVELGFGGISSLGNREKTNWITITGKEVLLKGKISAEAEKIKGIKEISFIQNIFNKILFIEEVYALPSDDQQCFCEFEPGAPAVECPCDTPGCSYGVYYGCDAENCIRGQGPCVENVATTCDPDVQLSCAFSFNLCVNNQCVSTPCLGCVDQCSADFDCVITPRLVDFPEWWPEECVEGQGGCNIGSDGGAICCEPRCPYLPGDICGAVPPPLDPCDPSNSPQVYQYPEWFPQECIDGQGGCHVGPNGGAVCCEPRCPYLPGDICDITPPPAEVACQTYSCIECIDGKSVSFESTSPCEKDKMPGDCSPSSHNECDSGVCLIVQGDGQDQCFSDDDCNQNHNTCVDQKCVSVGGEGPDECSTDSDCNQYHYICGKPEAGGDASKNVCELYADGSSKCVSVSIGVGGNFPGCSSDVFCSILPSWLKLPMSSGGPVYACKKVSGEGIDECAWEGDCGSHTECESGACVVKKGQGRDECTSDLSCSSHYICSSIVGCELVSGQGANQCDINIDPAYLGTSCSLSHNVCSAGGFCISVPGLGINECTGDSSCLSHNICEGCQCKTVSGPGRDLCQTSSQCQNRFSACLNGACVLVEGQSCGAQNLCSSSFDCLPKHSECKSNQCVLVVGSGVDKCKSPLECQLTHQGCDNGKCVEIAGSGTDLCSSDYDCEIDGAGKKIRTHTSCLYPFELGQPINSPYSFVVSEGFCINVLGPGVDECLRRNDCVVSSHTECNKDNRCVSVFGSGANKCESDKDCLSNPSICARGYNQATGLYTDNYDCRQLSIPYPYSGGQTCSSLEDCTGKVTACINDKCVLVKYDSADFKFNECQNNYDCSLAKHTECDNDKCVALAGTGPNECLTENDCFSTHMACNENSQCVSISGPGRNLCLSNTECQGKHSECVQESCALILGTGQNQCSSDCNCCIDNCSPSCSPIKIDHKGCINGSCVVIKGLLKDSCSSDSICQGNHSECQSGKCVLVSGIGPDKCFMDYQCASDPGVIWHTICAYSLSGPPVPQTPLVCTLAPGGGYNECISDFDCPESHTACNENNQCVSVPGMGQNLCFSDDNCCSGTNCVNPKHTECVDSQCALISGAGKNKCSGNSDCDVSRHTECDANSQCVLVNGLGTNQCSSSADCSLAHNVCCKNQCISVQGGGANQCNINDDCSDSKNICSQGQCVSISGEGQDECSTDNNCASSRNICQNNQCILVQGAGPNECCSSADCSAPSDTTCINHKCVSVPPGSGDNSCRYNYECASVKKICYEDKCLSVSCSGEEILLGMCEDECTNDSQCAPKHRACQNNQCVLVDGTGTDECLKSCYRGVCNSNNVCAQTLGENCLTGEKCCDLAKGNDGCDEQHLECLVISGSKVCALADAELPGECENDGDCFTNCGNDIVDTEEECGEPGLSCAPDQACVNCECKNIINNPPIVSPVSAVPTSACCSFNPRVDFSWLYQDQDNVPAGADLQSKYQIQIDDNSNFSSTVKDETANSFSDIYSTTDLDFNKTYYWRIKVWDSKQLASDWAVGANVPPVFAYPCPEFSSVPLATADKNANVAFTSLSGLPGRNICPTAPCSSYLWTFTLNNIVEKTSSSPNPTIKFNKEGLYSIKLIVQDSDNKTCNVSHSFRVGKAVILPPPMWKEIKPY